MSTRKMPRLEKYYREEIIPILKKELAITNEMRVPKLKKIVLNMGLGEAVKDPKAIENGVDALTVISGQKPVVTKARKSIATFKLREGMPIGVMVTLRGDRMWEFFDRMVNISLPRVRDFKGVQCKFDRNGNCSIGVKEQIIFPEVNYDKVDKVRGLNVTLVTSADTDVEGKALLKHLGVPFRN